MGEAGPVPIASCGVDRIAIIGCGGSGKTTVANRLGPALGLPVTHLDVAFYDERWNPLPQEEFAALQRDLVAAPRWVIDGNYASTMPIRLAAADTVIFLDLPARACLWGIAQRRRRYRGAQNDHDGVYDRITWGFIRYVWNYRRTMAPRVRTLINDHAANARVHVVRTRRAADHLVADLART